ncbi:hypothetical protein LG276_19650 [Cytobacillus kochii]|uniref:hypothetical protein n=1 Tax=Cytobacillus kochii TaxID=859143 RepID=UPI00384D3364
MSIIILIYANRMYILIFHSYFNVTMCNESAFFTFVVVPFTIRIDDKEGVILNG